MKLLIVSAAYPSHENPRKFAFVHSRVKMYQANGHNVLVVVPSYMKFFRSYIYESVKVVNCTFNDIKELTESFDPDIVLVHGPSGQWLRTFIDGKAWPSYFSKLHRPIITWIHGSETLVRAQHDFFSPWEFKEKFLSYVIDSIKCMVLMNFIRFSSALVYPSRWTRDASKKYLKCKHPNMWVIPNPVDTKFFRPSLEKELPASKGLAMRSFEWRYGLDIAILAFSGLGVSNLTIVGRGKMGRYLKKLADMTKSSVNFFTDYVEREKLPRFIGSFHYFINPSRQESQGVSMCEAMAMGLPSIATRVGGIPEFVYDGFNGLLVEPNDPASLRRAVIRVATNEKLYERLSKNARSFVEKQLSYDVIYDREKILFEKCLACDLQ